MKKIMIPIMNRANYGRLKSVLSSISFSQKLSLQLIVGGSTLLDKYGCIEAEKDGFKILDTIYCVVEGNPPVCMSTTLGLLTIQFCKLLETYKPNAVLVHADRYEMLALAASAAYMNIPVIHTQGGEISGNIDNKVRNAITMLADIHFTATELSTRRVLEMRRDAKVYNVGCPSIDIAKTVVDSFIKCNGVGKEIDFSSPYIVVMFHPVTTEFGMVEKQVTEIIKAIEKINIQTVWFWNNVDAGNDDVSSTLRKWREMEGAKNVGFYKNFTPENFYCLFTNPRLICLLGNSSCGIREGSYLQVPYVCVGTRQLNREHGDNVIFVDYDEDQIFKEVQSIIKYKKTPKKYYGYGDGTAGKQIVNILERIL